MARVQAALLARITGVDLGVPANDVGALVRGGTPADVARRLEVYASMYRSRLGEALESQFPRLARVVGGDGFAALVAAYVADEPSHHPSLREIGRALPGWLAAHCPDRPALPWLAALEWARLDVYDQPDETLLTLESLRAIPGEAFAEVHLRLVAAHRFVEVDAGTESLWDNLGPEAEAPALALDAAAGAPGTLLVWRQGSAVYHRAPEPEELSALKVVAAGAPFGVICEQLCATRNDETAAARAFAWLSGWTADGLLIAR